MKSYVPALIHEKTQKEVRLMKIKEYFNYPEREGFLFLQFCFTWEKSFKFLTSPLL